MKGKRKMYDAILELIATLTYAEIKTFNNLDNLDSYGTTIVISSGFTDGDGGTNLGDLRTALTALEYREDIMELNDEIEQQGVKLSVCEAPLNVSRPTTGTRPGRP